MYLKSKGFARKSLTNKIHEIQFCGNISHLTRITMITLINGVKKQQHKMSWKNGVGVSSETYLCCAVNCFCVLTRQADEPASLLSYNPTIHVILVVNVHTLQDLFDSSNISPIFPVTTGLWPVLVSVCVDGYSSRSAYSVWLFKRLSPPSHVSVRQVS